MTPHPAENPAVSDTLLEQIVACSNISAFFALTRILAEEVLRLRRALREATQ